MQLEKNNDLISAASTMFVHNAGSGETQQKNIVVHPYKGVVLSTGFKGISVEKGWARVMFHDE